MDEMLGTFDKANRAFIVEREEFRQATGKPNVRMSIRRLQKLYPECPNDERGARPFWNKYLKSVLLGQEPNQSELETLRDKDEWWLRGEMPIPDGFYRDREGTIQQVTVKHNGIKAEVDTYLDRRTQTYKNKKAVLLVKQYLNLFLSITGDIKLEAITRQHYETYHQKVINHKTWVAKRSKANAMQRLNSFLTHLETVNTNLNFKFRHSPEFRIRGANVGQKNQWELPQLQEAIKLSKDTPRVRFALLMAINTGAYWGDLMMPKGEYHGLQKDDIKGDYLKDVPREKNNTKDRITKGTWWLFPETKKALMFGLSKSQLETTFTSFRDEHGLPLFLDIRKTISQLIHDDIGETEARLWRCEELEGCIGTNYVKMFSEEQIADLKRALIYVRGVLIEGKPRRNRRGKIRKQG
ncbi:MAG: hypothetical protein K2R98_33760 [Gemmataceae bacterium]|nr:hypothetical protein [Gemmataceae bacterium]